jgi:outer membrane lipoprotein carrier protein
MISTLRSAALALGVALAAVSNAAAAAPPAVGPEQAVRNLDAAFVSLRSLEADFEQEYFSTTIATPLRESGRFTFQKPDSMRWEYKDPEPHVFVVKEGKVWDYVPEDNQMVVTALSAEQKNSAIFALLTGRAKVEDNYVIQAAEFPSDRRAAVQVKLVPRQEGEFSHILIEIDTATWLIDRIVTLDWAGAKQEFVFRRFRLNARLPESTFEVKVPAGTEIIEDAPVPKR